MNNHKAEANLLDRLFNKETRHIAFKDLVVLYQEELYWKIRRIVISHEDAHDVLQNVFIKIWNNIDNFQNKSSLATWMYRIAINEALDFLRQKKKNAINLDEADSVVSQKLNSDSFFDANKAQLKLQEAIALLPEMQRIVFQLRYYDELKYSEISKILNTTEGSLKANYHLAVKKIKAFLLQND